MDSLSWGKKWQLHVSDRQLQIAKAYARLKAFNIDPSMVGLIPGGAKKLSQLCIIVTANILYGEKFTLAHL